MSAAITARTHLKMLRFNIDQAQFRSNRQIDGVFASSMIYGALWRLEEAEYTMAGKVSVRQNGWSDTEFINVDLTEAMITDYQAWIKVEMQKVPDLLGQVMIDDYKVSCSWDEKNQCFIATFTGKDVQRVNDRKAMSSRSDDWYEALSLNLYKHLKLFNSGVWSGKSERRNWG